MEQATYLICRHNRSSFIKFPLSSTSHLILEVLCKYVYNICLYKWTLQVNGGKAFKFYLYTSIHHRMALVTETWNEKRNEILSYSIDLLVLSYLLIWWNWTCKKHKLALIFYLKLLITMSRSTNTKSRIWSWKYGRGNTLTSA